MLFNTSVAEIHGLKKTKSIPKDALGIEIEMEHSAGFDITKLPMESWQIKSDGSLRNFGVEFVSEPFSVKNIGNVVGKQWTALLDNPLMKNRNNECPRASVHVHVNVKEFTYNQLMNVITAYSLLEGVLIAYCGKYRVGNLFALAIPEAPSNLYAVKKAIHDYTMIRLNSEHRYGALNMCSLSRFGTLEFRMMGSVYDPGLIQLWATGLRSMVDHAASAFENPPAVYDRYVHASREEFVKEFLGELGEAILKKPISNELFESGEDVVIELLSTNTDNWTYEGDFRNNKEFTEYAKNEMGWTNAQILSSTLDHFRSVMSAVKKRSTPTIRPRGSPDWAGSRDDDTSDARDPDDDEEPVNWVVDGSTGNLVAVPPEPAPDRRTRGLRGFTFTNPFNTSATTVTGNIGFRHTERRESFRTLEDRARRGTRVIRWAGTLPRDAFFEENQWENYLARMRITNEGESRRRSDALSHISDVWVDTQFLRWADEMIRAEDTRLMQEQIADFGEGPART